MYTTKQSSLFVIETMPALEGSGFRNQLNERISAFAQSSGPNFQLFLLGGDRSARLGEDHL